MPQAKNCIVSCRAGCTAAEFERLVQRNMAANAGLGYAGLADLVATIAERELACMAQPTGAAASTAANSTAAVGTVPAAVRDRAAVPAAAGGDGAAALCSGKRPAGCEGSDGTTDAPSKAAAELQHLFNLRRALFVLEDLTAHAREVHDNGAGELEFAELTKRTEVLLAQHDSTL